jgi:hypothetical protein
MPWWILWVISQGVLLVSRWLCLVSFVGAFVWVLLWIDFWVFFRFLGFSFYGLCWVFVG